MLHISDVEQLVFIMDGLTVNDRPSTCEQCSGYGYSSASATSSAVMQYSSPLTHSSCAEVTAVSNPTHVETEVVEDCIHIESTAYSVSSSSSQSPLLHQSGAVMSASDTTPASYSSDDQRKMSHCSSYHSRCPVFMSSSRSSSSYSEATKTSSLEPPKKPLTPYMRFSKSVRNC